MISPAAILFTTLESKACIRCQKVKHWQKRANAVCAKGCTYANPSWRPRITEVIFRLPLQAGRAINIHLITGHHEKLAVGRVLNCR